MDLQHPACDNYPLEMTAETGLNGGALWIVGFIDTPGVHP